LLQLVRHGLEVTALLWPPLQTGYTLIHQAAHLLANQDKLDGATLRQAYQDQIVTPWQVHEAPDDPLAAAAATFAKVTASYWPNLFYCYDVPDLPRTNNDLEQFFGAARHLERRATGRKMASPAVVVRGAVRVVALMAARHQPFSTNELRPRDVAAWKTLRRRTDARHAARRVQARFRRNPVTYLADLETRLLKPALPS
jgi:hypothetical protein